MQCFSGGVIGPVHREEDGFPHALSGFDLRQSEFAIPSEARGRIRIAGPPPAARSTVTNTLDRAGNASVSPPEKAILARPSAPMPTA